MEYRCLFVVFRQTVVASTRSKVEDQDVESSIEVMRGAEWGTYSIFIVNRPHRTIMIFIVLLVDDSDSIATFPQQGS